MRGWKCLGRGVARAGELEGEGTCMRRWEYLGRGVAGAEGLEGEETCVRGERV